MNILCFLIFKKQIKIQKFILKNSEQCFFNLKKFHKQKIFKEQGIFYFFECLAFWLFCKKFNSFPWTIQNLSHILASKLSNKYKMINSPRCESVHKESNFKRKDLAAIYQKIIHKFENEAVRIKKKNSQQDFDDTVISGRRKVPPTFQQQSPHKIKRKFYSNKLILNDTLYINERKQKSINEVMSDFKKLSIPSPFKNGGVLSERNRRIKELYERVSRNSVSPGVRSKFPKHIQDLHKHKYAEQLPTHFSVNLPGEHKGNIGSNSAKNQKQKLFLPNLHAQRSKSSMMIQENMKDDNPQQETQCTPGEVKTVEAHHRVTKKHRSKVVSHKKLSGNQNLTKIRFPTFNWRKQILQLGKVGRQTFNNLIRFYLNIGPVNPIGSGFYRAYIGPGNNGTLIKKALKDRGYWIIVDSINENPHFVWTQLRTKKISQHLTYTNIKPLQAQKKNEDSSPNQKKTHLIEFLKIKRNDFLLTSEQIMEKNVFEKFASALMMKFKKNQNIKQFSQLRSQTIQSYQNVNQKKNETVIEASQARMHNHIEDAGCIGDKKGLLEMLQHYGQIFETQIDDFVPKTIHIKSSDDTEQIVEEMAQGAWIVKPGQATNRGQGITVHTTKQSLLEELGKKKKHKNGIRFTHIVQQYIEPLLYFNRKFDIRVWVLWNGQQAWWYQEGYVRTASRQYTMKSTNKFVHLTNDAIQCHCDEYGKYEPANKVSFNELSKYLEAQYDYRNFASSVIPAMKELARMTFRMASLVFRKKRQLHSFELFGLDFLLDNKFKPWLIQCNTNPCLEINCSLLARLIPNMLNNVLNLTADVIFPAPSKKRIKEQSLNHHTFKFQLLIDGAQDIQIHQKMKEREVNVEYKGEYEQQFMEE